MVARGHQSTGSERSVEPEHGGAEGQGKRQPDGRLELLPANQQHFTGEAQAQAESMLKPQVFASQSSQDADRVISGGVGQVAQSITQEAQQQHVDPVLALTTAK